MLDRPVHCVRESPLVRSTSRQRTDASVLAWRSSRTDGPCHAIPRCPRESRSGPVAPCTLSKSGGSGLLAMAPSRFPDTRNRATQLAKSIICGRPRRYPFSRPQRKVTCIDRVLARLVGIVSPSFSTEVVPSFRPSVWLYALCLHYKSARRE